MRVTDDVELSSTSRDIIRIILLCAAWYTTASSASIIVKTLLNDFPYPMTVTMIQLLGTWVLLPPILRCWRIPPVNPIVTPWRYYFTMIFPLALAKIITSVAAHVSLWKATVSYAHTVKATMPFFTIILSKIFMNESQTLKIYISIIPIILGVCIATVTEMAFEISGLISALIATLGIATLNIFTKMALKETGIHHLRMLLIISKITFVLFLPVWVVIDLRRIFQDEAVMGEDRMLWSITLLLVDALANFLINVIAFTLLALVTPLSYAVANATKRIVIISSSLILLKNPVTSANVFGTLLAISGVLLYNKAKFDLVAEKRRQSILPLVRSEANLYNHNLHLSPLHRTNTDFDLHNHFTIVPTEELDIEDKHHNGIGFQQPTLYSRN